MGNGPTRRLLATADRERIMLKTARHILHEGDYRSLTIDRLAKQSGVSRMTVYKHFSDIDDVIMALCIQSTARRADLVEQAALYTGHTRERMADVLSVVGSLDPYHLEYESILYATKIVSKAKPERQQAFQHHHHRLTSVAAGIVREAIIRGDLVLGGSYKVERLAESLLTLNRLTYLSRYGGYDLTREAIAEFWKDKVRADHLLMDNLGWQPLSSEHNYIARTNRMWRELFAELLARFTDHVMLHESQWKELFPDYTGPDYVGSEYVGPLYMGPDYVGRYYAKTFTEVAIPESPRTGTGQ